MSMSNPSTYIVCVRNKTIIGLKCMGFMILNLLMVVRNKTIIGLKYPFN